MLDPRPLTMVLLDSAIRKLSYSAGNAYYLSSLRKKIKRCVKETESLTMINAINK